MVKGNRVRHKSGIFGKVTEVTKEWVYVLLDGEGMTMPYRAEWLEVIEKEGEHEPGQSSGDAEELPEL